MLKFGIQRRKVIGQTIWLLRPSGMPIRFVAVGSRFPASACGNISYIHVITPWQAVTHPGSKISRGGKVTV